MEFVCDKVFPKTIQAECHSFVDQYGPVIINLLVQGVKPDKICQFLTLCKKSTLVLNNEVNATPQCILCEFFLTVLAKYANENSSAVKKIYYCLFLWRC